MEPILPFTGKHELSRQAIGPKVWDTNVVVMTDAGKPIFARFGSEEQTSNISGLVQTIRTSLVYNRVLNLRDIKCLRSKSLCLVFMVVDSIILVAIARSSSETHLRPVEAYLKLQLEYVYAHIVAALPQVHSMLEFDPGFDMSDALGITENVIREALDDMETDPFVYLTMAASTFFPMLPTVREHASEVLYQVGSSTKDTLFALIVCNGQLVTLVQPAHWANQLRVSDLHILLKVIYRQPSLLSSELWLPLCFPRFNAKGMLHCYSYCLHSDTKTMLLLVSHRSDIEQFESFRRAAIEVRRKLYLRHNSSSVLEILGTDEGFTSQDGEGNDIRWRRTEGGVDSSDDDYVDASGDGDRMIPYVYHEEFSFVEELTSGLQFKQRSAIKEYLDLAGASYFVFRLNGDSARHKDGKKQHLSQCICSDIATPSLDWSARRRIWSTFERLALRLRLGCAMIEPTLDAFDMIAGDRVASKEAVTTGMASRCPSIGLFESPPNVQGVSYVIEDRDTFLAINGHDFELYVVAPSTVPLKQAAALGARLARQLIIDQRTIFASTSLTWNE